MEPTCTTFSLFFQFFLHSFRKKTSTKSTNPAAPTEREKTKREKSFNKTSIVTLNARLHLSKHRQTEVNVTNVTLKSIPSERLENIWPVQFAKLLSRSQHLPRENTQRNGNVPKREHLRNVYRLDCFITTPMFRLWAKNFVVEYVSPPRKTGWRSFVADVGRTDLESIFESHKSLSTQRLNFLLLMILL